MRRGRSASSATATSPSARESYFFDYVKQTAHRALRPRRASARGGLHVYTTIDLDLQQAAREAIDRPARRPRTAPAAIVTIDPRNGYIKAMASSSQLRRLEVQPRRPGPPPAGLDVQGHGADDGAAPGVDPDVDDLHVAAAEARLAAERRRYDGHRRYAQRLRRPHEPRRGDAALRQLASTRSSTPTSGPRRSRRPPTTWASRPRSTATRPRASAA